MVLTATYIRMHLEVFQDSGYPLDVSNDHFCQIFQTLSFVPTLNLSRATKSFELHRMYSDYVEFKLKFTSHLKLVAIAITMFRVTLNTLEKIMINEDFDVGSIEWVQLKQRW